ncbi:MAG: NADH:flavin oxidoreductase/NADH oxidase [Candidatus Melainabacteria bacterium]|nr:NADH:flavin oxidoreductase/NADH oxidase [Candidatus Melainabacteria bacterium]
MSNAISQEHTISPEGGQGKTADGLFSPLKIKSVTLKNRIAISPMCQYHSVDGFAEDWHLVHLGSRAVGGAGLVVMEASGVEARGRISPDDLGIYKDEHIEKLKQITTFISSFGAVAGIQIAHAGRKASTRNPWKGGNRHEKEYLTSENGGWEIVGPSPLPFSESSTVPKELTIEEIHSIQDSFAAAAKRAHAAGFKWLEVHAAHGYLLHSFYSLLSNRRTDKYGGSLENRMRNTLETVEKVRAAWPEELPLTVRISASDWAEGGWTPEDSVVMARALKDLGVDLIDCSSGFIRAGDRYPLAPGWQVPLARKVRTEAGIATGAVGQITEAEQAHAVIQNGDADLVFIARESIRDPYWPYHAARSLGSTVVDDARKVLPINYSYAI